eukprot:6192973-Pleurochrysis_carterae.AAC.2
MRATGSQNLRSGARALRKNACNASVKCETVHAGQKKRRAASLSNRVLATRAKDNAIATIALRAIMPNENRKVQMGYGSR